jgi:hypothetical protein
MHLGDGLDRTLAYWLEYEDRGDDVACQKKRDRICRRPSDRVTVLAAQLWQMMGMTSRKSRARQIRRRAETVCSEG